MSNIIYNSEEERIAVEYFSRLSDMVGAVGIGVCFTLLQFENPIKAASVSAFLFFCWSISLGREYSKMLKRANSSSKPSTWMFFRYAWFGWFALVFMFCIALGVITPEHFK